MVRDSTRLLPLARLSHFYRQVRNVSVLIDRGRKFHPRTEVFFDNPSLGYTSIGMINAEVQPDH